MKKLLSFILSALILLGIFTVSVSAKEISGFAGTITVDGTERTYIRNEYYQLYHDVLFEQTYTVFIDGVENGITKYEELSDGIGQIVTISFADLGKINADIHETVKNSEDTYCLSVYLNYSENFSKEENETLLGTIDGIDEILYVGTTTPCAIIVVTGKNIDKVLESDVVMYLSYAFGTFSDKYTSVIPENGNRTYTPNAAHARKVLRYAAGLYDLSDMETLADKKEFLIMSDTDFDGKITAKDARTSLRIAAGLEAKVEFTHITDSFWSSI